MGSMLIRNVRLVEPGKQVRRGAILLRDGRIAALGEINEKLIGGAEVVEGADRLLTPGLIDVHTHGIMQYLFESGPGDMILGARELPQFGVTTVLPTIVPHIETGWLERLRELVAALPSVREVNIPGLHLEGPFLALPGAGCATIPGSMDLLEQILFPCNGRLAAMSVSPDTPNILPVIHRLCRENVRVFLTHTKADVEQTEAALQAGASHATHFYDVFYPPAESDPGVRPVGAVEAILADPRASVDFVADGVHVHPTAIRAAVAAKTWAGVILCTDSVIGAGLPSGIYDTPWGFQIRVSPEGASRDLTTKNLAGSSLTMNRGMANLLRWLNLPPEKVWAMGTDNTARMLGLDRVGRLKIGFDADLVLWEENLTAAQTWVRGNLVYQKSCN